MPNRDAARRDLPDRAAYLAGWSDLHGDLAPSALVRYWLGACYLPARTLARAGTAPAAITATALLAALAAPALVGWLGGWWLLVAAAMVVISGVLDNLDGGVAVLTGRSTAFGAVLDSVCDRFADTAYCVALWAAGAPGWLAGVVAFAGVLQEYVRARAAGVGMRGVGVVTLWERPTRVIMAALLLVGCVVLRSAAGVVATAGLAVSLGLALVGNTQLLRTCRRELR